MQLRLASVAQERLKRFSLAVVLVAAGCARPAPGPDVLAAMTIAPRPARVGSETMVLQLTDVSKQPVTGDRVEVEGDMSHPGMAPVFAVARELAPGRYTAKLQLTMAGDWMILFHITLRSGQKVEKEMPLPGVRN